MGILPALVFLLFNRGQGSADALRVARAMDLRVSGPWLEPDPTKGLGPESAPEMIRLLSVVRRAATFDALSSALRRLERRDAIPVLIQNLGRPLDAPPSQAPYHALEGWGWPAIPALARGLASPRVRVRFACARLLAAQCAQQRVLKDPPLRGLMLRLAASDETVMREIALQGLWSLAQRTQEWSMDGVHEVEGPYDSLAMRGIIDLAFDRDAGVRRLAVERLSFLLTHAHDEKTPLFRAVAVAIKRNEYGIHASYPTADPDPLVRHAATVGASQLGYVPPPAREMDLKILPDLVFEASDSNPRTRARVAERLRGVIGLVRPGPALIRSTLVRLAHDDQPPVRLASIDGLFKLAQRTHQDHAEYDIHFSAGPYDRVALRALIELAYDDDPTVCNSARSHLAFLSHLLRRETERLVDPAETSLTKAIASPEPAIRSAAIALAFVSGRPGLGIQGMADDDPLVRDAGRLGLRRTWLGRTGEASDRNLANLLALLGDPRSGVRKDAVGAVADAWRPTTIPRLLPLLRDPDPGVRAAAGHTIRALRGDYLLPGRST